MKTSRLESILVTFALALFVVSVANAQSKSKDATIEKADQTVTVTLVRWPYT